jgi:hypothetical protein
MLAASLLAIFLIPVSFYVIEKLTHTGEKRAPAEAGPRPGLNPERHQP